MSIVKNVIEHFRKAGKTENEISGMIEQAADRATVNKGVAEKKEYKRPEIKVETSAEQFVEAVMQTGVTAEQVKTAIMKMCDSQRCTNRQNTNNWRKMHGLPMRRKQKARNEEWEKNFFQPIVIGDRCCIHSTFHKDTPKTEYEILINPQMAFGTGHHETTSSIISEMLEADLKGKSVLDMGCGTSILAILASMRGANPVTAIDIDDWCVNNSKDNIALNHIHNITVELGDANLLKGRKPFDVIIANINRNILLADLPHYAACMHPGSEIFMSGFYMQDIPFIREKAESLGMEFVHHREKNNWAAVKFIMK